MKKPNDALKPGDKLYRVYSGFLEYEIEEVTIKKITATKVWFTESGGLSFHCRTGIEVDAASRCARTPRQAVEEFIKSERENRKAAIRDYEAAYAWSQRELGRLN